MDLIPDTWYQKLSIEFEDGSTEVLHIERRSTGTHIPMRQGKPEPWTKLSFHKCSCCPYPDHMLACPAALSLQTTMSKIRARKSTERVTAVAIDARGRAQTVEWPLQNVGSTLVQLAVFASACPVGRRLKPYLVGLPPFASAFELSRQIATKILQKHGGSVEAARKELTESLAPLHEVFVRLTERFRADERDLRDSEKMTVEDVRDAVPNSLTQVDAFAQLFDLRADKLLAELSSELGWTGEGEAPVGSWWQRLFGSGR
ncbi:DUF6901 family protein [Elusimicrobiota bacterium]